MKTVLRIVPEWSAPNARIEDTLVTVDETGENCENCIFQEGFSLRCLQLISVASYQMLPDTQPAAASLCAPQVGGRRRQQLMELR